MFSKNVEIKRTKWNGGVGYSQRFKDIVTFFHRRANFGEWLFQFYLLGIFVGGVHGSFNIYLRKSANQGVDMTTFLCYVNYCTSVWYDTLTPMLFLFFWHLLYYLCMFYYYQYNLAVTDRFWFLNFNACWLYVIATVGGGTVWDPGSSAL